MNWAGECGSGPLKQQSVPHLNTTGSAQVCCAVTLQRARAAPSRVRAAAYPTSAPPGGGCRPQGPALAASRPAISPRLKITNTAGTNSSPAKRPSAFRGALFNDAQRTKAPKQRRVCWEFPLVNSQRLATHAQSDTNGFDQAITWSAYTCAHGQNLARNLHPLVRILLPTAQFQAPSLVPHLTVCA